VRISLSNQLYAASTKYVSVIGWVLLAVLALKFLNNDTAYPAASRYGIDPPPTNFVNLD